MTLRWTITLYILPLLYLVLDLKQKQRIVFLLFFALIDYEQSLMSFSFYNHLSSAKLSSVTYLLNTKKEFYLIFYPILFIISSFFIWWLAKFLSFLRRKKSYYVLIFYFLLISLLLTAFSEVLSYRSQYSSYALIIINIITRKIWLIFLISNVFIYGKGKNSFSDILEGYLSPALSVRENLILDNYKVDKLESFQKAVKLSLAMIIIICIYDQLKYQITGKIFGFVWINDWAQSLNCQPVNSPIGSLPNIELSLYTIWGCRAYSHIFIGIIKHILIDGFYFYIPMLMMGYHIQLPYNNFYSARKFTHFLFGMFYYYGLNIYRIFIIEFYKLLLEIFKRRNRFMLPISTFLGVYLGGILWHIIEDYLFIQASTDKNILSYVFTFNFQVYFLGLALFCFISEFLKFKIYLGRLQFLRFIFYLIVLINLRYLFSGYFNGEDMIYLKIQLVLKSFGI